MNNRKCSDCKFYDPIQTARGRASHGWCAAKSVYPAKEGAGQLFPPHVKRAASETSPAKPVIVRPDDVVISCTEVAPK